MAGQRLERYFLSYKRGALAPQVKHSPDSIAQLVAGELIGSGSALNGPWKPALELAFRGAAGGGAFGL